jgi:hypothetical protein
MKSRVAHPLTRVVGAVFIVLSLGAGVAEAQGMKSLRDKMFGAPSAEGRSGGVPKIAHYISEEGESFVFDSSRSTPLLRFDGEGEVWALTPTPGTKGDIIYKNDLGEPVLKATRWGGMVLYSDDRPMGDPAAVAGKAEAFRPAVMTPVLLWQSLAKASRRASQAVERLIPFDAQGATPESAALYADAFDVTSSAIVRVAQTSRGGRKLPNIREVHFVEGRPPSVRVEKGILVMKLDSSRGAWGGRVSSKRVVNVLTASYSIADDRR